jgi:hypothetical protein
MITKESLQKAKESVNEAILKIKQSYSASPTSKKVFFVVEGKDDIPFYATKADDYIPNGWKLIIVPAQNRKKAVETYRQLDWARYKKSRILFFIDRDLSDYTGEDTPIDFNIYITEKYAIENELCTEQTYIKAIRYYCDLNDIDDNDENALLNFFQQCWNDFSRIADPIMAQILYWKTNAIASNYSNFKMQNIFDIMGNQLQSRYEDVDSILHELFRQSQVPYVQVDISPYIDLLKSKHTPDEYIRGKFILTFFSKTLNYSIRNSKSIIPSGKKAKDSLGLGYENVIAKLCGIMRPPASLTAFFKQMQNNLEPDIA